MPGVAIEHARMAYDWWEAIDEGQPAWQIARTCGVSAKTIQRWRIDKRDGVKSRIRGPRKQVGDEVIQKARVMLEEGMSQAEVCRTLKIGKQTVRRYLPGMAWDRKQVIDFAVSVRKINREARKNGVKWR